MAIDTETVVRKAYHAAEGDVLDTQGFIALFAADGVCNAIGGESYRGAHLGEMIVGLAEMIPDVHRELHRVNVFGDVAAIELSIQGTFAGPFRSPAGVIQPTGAKLDIPCADFWYLENGKVKEFNCHTSVSVMLAQVGVRTDFAAAVAVPPTAGS
ncbi:ester cyclase [Nocardia sp. NPDC060256]|uniref:ester cyclase n=1 Tax=unclassified Nocardia TaxID=2637762 RepID=UPI0036638B6D